MVISYKITPTVNPSTGYRLTEKGQHPRSPRGCVTAGNCLNKAGEHFHTFYETAEILPKNIVITARIILNAWQLLLEQYQSSRLNIHPFLLKTESLDSAMLELWLAKPSFNMSHYTMLYKPMVGGDEWSLRAFASMPSTAIFLRARAEIKNLLCEQRAV